MIVCNPAMVITENPANGFSLVRGIFLGGIRNWTQQADRRVKSWHQASGPYHYDRRAPGRVWHDLRIYESPGRDHWHVASQVWRCYHTHNRSGSTGLRRVKADSGPKSLPNPTPGRLLAVQLG